MYCKQYCKYRRILISYILFIFIKHILEIKSFDNIVYFLLHINKKGRNTYQNYKYIRSGWKYAKYL